VINAEKCVFGHSSLELLGHIVKADGISPLPDRIAVIHDFPLPNMVVELQTFLGIFNYCR
jgi:hypothetical protein